MPKDEEDREDDLTLTCPECKAVVRVPVEKAERDMKARCPNGHEIPLAKAMG